jgi:hypothetical protein
MFGPIQILGSSWWRVLGVEHFSRALSPDFVRRTPPLNHGHEASWWRELFLLVGRLSLLGLLDHSGLMALLYDVCWWVRRWRWSIIGYRPCHWLLDVHPLLKCPVETKELPALDEEVCRFSYSVLVEIRMPWASAIKHLLCRQLWLPATPLFAGLRITAAAAVVSVSSSR